MRDCPHCRDLEPVFEEGRTCLLYREAAQTLVQELKYRRGTFLLPDFERIIRGIDGLADYIGSAVLVPVPLHPRKERERGFNQSRLIAGVFAGLTPDASVASLLRRVKDTATQTRLDRDARQRNVSRAFAPAVSREALPKRPMILVDDIFTTGATLNACAEVLREAGGQSVRILTLAHG